MTVRCSWKFICQTRSNINATDEDPLSGAVQRVGSFTDNWYSSKTIDTEPLLQDMLSYAALRAACLPVGFSIAGFEQTELGAVPRSIPFNRAYPGTMNLQSDQPGATLVYKAHATTQGAERDFDIKGVPDPRIKKGTFNPSTDWTQATNALFDFIQEKFLMQAIDQSKTKYNVVEVSSAGVLTSLAELPFEVGQFVQVMRSRFSNGKRGGQICQVVAKAEDNKSLTLLNWTGGYTTGGKVRQYSLIYPAVVFKNESRLNPKAAYRKIGKALFSFRGKNSRRR